MGAQVFGTARRDGDPPHVPTEQDFARAVQAHIDATAAAKGYGSGVHLASYVASTVPQWADEANAFVPWRDAVWVYVYQQMEAVLSGARPMPTIDGLVAELPAITWPSGT